MYKLSIVVAVFPRRCQWWRGV